MPLAIAVDSRTQSSIQQQMVERLRSMILSGLLPQGSRLPSTRSLSEQLAVSRGTVVIAYQQLVAEGYLETHSTAATIVSRDLPEHFIRAHHDDPPRAKRDQNHAMAFHAEPPRLFDPAQDELPYDFRIGRAESGFFPIKAWRRLIPACLGGAEHALCRYGDPAGYPPLREAICHHLLRARGIRCTADQVVIVAGCQEGLNILARMLVAPGAPVAIEDPCYQGAAGAFESHYARMVPIPVDQEGLDVEQLAQSGAKLVYVTPSHQFPLGVTMPLDRRRRLIEWARKADGYVIEDDYDSDFRYERSPLPALKALDGSQRVIYAGTFSKSIGAGLRLGYLVVPPQLVRAAATAKALAGNGHPWLEQAVMAEFIRSGAFETHLRLIRKRYLARRDCLIGALKRHFGPACLLQGFEGGMHLSLRLNGTAALTAHQLQTLARQWGVGIYSLKESPSRQFERFEGDEEWVFLGYAVLPEYRIETAVEIIAQIIGNKGK